MIRKQKVKTFLCCFQCSECVDGFLGQPTEGHQCFRQMIVERDQCLDPSTQMNCHNDPQPLLWGRTVFFGVQPKYLNVDIRITLDVTSGGLDLYFSPENTTFVISVDPVTGIHAVSIDPAFPYEDITPSSTIRQPEDVLQRSPRTKRDTDDASKSDPSGGSQTHYRLEEKQASDFNNFITIDHEKTFLIVRNIHHRLVITLPNTVHHLKVGSRIFKDVLHHFRT